MKQIGEKNFCSNVFSVSASSNFYLMDDWHKFLLGW